MASTGLLQRAFALFGSVMAAAPVSKPSRTSAVLSQPTNYASSSWDVSTVRSALDMHERGDFSRSALLVDAMGRDDRISGCLNTRLNALCGVNGLDFSIVAPDGGDQKLADAVESWWFDVVPDPVLRQLLSDAVMIGVAVARKHWTLTGKSWNVTRIERWHPSNVRWDDYRKQYAAMTHAGEVFIEPGDPEWLLITPGGDQSWMVGAVRALGLPFVMRSWNWRDWMRFNERHGLPIIAVKEPPEFEDGAKDRFYQSLKRMGQNGIVRLPQGTDGTGFDVDFKEARDTAHATFQAFRADLDVSIAVYLLGQNLTTEVQGGSLAATNAHARVAGFVLAADAEAMSTPLRVQLIVPWCVFNYGTDPKLCPWPQWDTDPPEQLSESAKTLETLGKAVSGLQNTGLPVDAIEIATRFNVPLLQGAPMGEPYRPPAPGSQPGNSSDPASSSAKAMHAQGLPFNAASGFVQGQLWVDDLTDDSHAKAADAMGAFIGALKRAVAKSGSYEELRANVLAEFKGSASPERLREILTMAMVMSQMAGRASARQDS